jgi:hypothetical protein
MQWEKLEAQREKYAGLRPLERERRIAMDLLGWAGGGASDGGATGGPAVGAAVGSGTSGGFEGARSGPGKVYLVATEPEIERLRGLLFSPRYFRIVATIRLPEPPEDARRARGPGGLPRGPAGGMGGPGAPGAGPFAWWGTLQQEGHLVIAEWTWRP